MNSTYTQIAAGAGRNEITYQSPQLPQIQVIEPVHPVFGYQPEKLRVCAYARVSSDSDDQLNSFTAQVDYYTEHITGNDEWDLVDIYDQHWVHYALKRAHRLREPLSSVSAGQGSMHHFLDLRLRGTKSQNLLFSCSPNSPAALLGRFCFDTGKNAFQSCNNSYGGF